MSGGTDAGTRSAGRLLERERECSVIEQLIRDAVRGEGRLVLVQGPAGIGKTRLLAVARERAEACGLGPLQASGGELERDFGFGVTRQLLERVVWSRSEAARRELLSGAARLAAPALGHEVPGDPSDPGRGPEATLHGLYWLCASLADEQPRLILVDDLQWADRPSLRFLHYLARRLEGLRLLVAASARTDEPGLERGPIAELAAQPEAVLLAPEPLSPLAVAVVVEEALGATPEGIFTTACHRACGGNPMLLRALVDELAAGAISPVADEADRVTRAAPSSVAQAVLARMRRLPAEAEPVARAVAVLEEVAEVHRVARLAGVDVDSTIAAIDALAAASILEPGRPLRFVHPMVKTAVYDTLSAGERARQHARAARLLHGERAELGRIASHLLATHRVGDEWTVARLEEAAAGAVGEGAPDSARVYLARALEEPPSEERRRGLLLGLGSVELQLGDAEAAGAHFEDARALSWGTPERAEASLALGRALIAQMRLEQAAGTLAAAEAEVEGVDDSLWLRLAAERLSTLPFGTVRAQLETWREELRVRVELGGAEVRPLLALIAHVLLCEGRSEDAAAAAEQALEGGTLIDELGLSSPYGMSALHTLIRTGREESAQHALEVAMERARARGAVADFAVGCTSRSQLMYRRGYLREAEADARRGYELLGGGLASGFTPLAHAFLVDVLVETGELDEAAAVMEGWPAAGDLPQSSVFIQLLDSRARLRNAEGRHASALDDALECGRRLAAWGCPSPAILEWRDVAAMALLGLGRRDEARRLAVEESVIARRLELARALGIALRVEGLATGGQAGIDLLREAVAALEGSEARLELARALADLGAALRRANRRAEAREPLRRGLELARACGATALARRAHTELWATGARPRTPRRTGLGALTPSERRVAEMAAANMTNAAIAQALFVTVKTIENHLSHAYAKLKIKSRAELPATLAMAETGSGEPRGGQIPGRTLLGE